MLLPVMRRTLPALLATAVLAPLPLAGCDLIEKLKGGGAVDAGDGAVAPTLAPTALPAGTAADTGATSPPATPLTTTTTTSTLRAVRPVVAADAGTRGDAAAPVPVIDAGAGKADAGTPSPLPTPTLNLPNLLDGGFKLDAGGFKPPWLK